MTIIMANDREHATASEAQDEIAERYGREEISDSVALAVASWWQSPGLLGKPFSELASTGKVDHMALLNAIHYARNEATNYGDRVALDMLATWTIDKMMRAEGRR